MKDIDDLEKKFIEKRPDRSKMRKTMFF